MSERTLRFLQWFSDYAKGAKEIEVAGSALSPELKKLIKFETVNSSGSFHGVIIKVVPSFKVVG